MTRFHKSNPRHLASHRNFRAQIVAKLTIRPDSFPPRLRRPIFTGGTLTNGQQLA